MSIKELHVYIIFQTNDTKNINHPLYITVLLIY